MRLSRSIEKLSRAVIARGEFEAVQGKERGEDHIPQSYDPRRPRTS